MSNLAIIPQQINLPPALLAELNALNGTDDLSGGVSSGFASISIRGSKWRIVEGGEEKPLYIPGTTDLAPSIKVVLLRANAAVSKVFYAGSYVEGSDAKPDCYSNTGITPGSDVAAPQCATCAACPQNAWGSKISPSGSKIKACSDVRRVAVLAEGDLTHPAALLRVPAASLADLAAYGKALAKRGIPYAAVVTKLSFDPDAAYPKIAFAFDRVLGQDEMQTVAEQATSSVVDDILGLSAGRGSPALAAPAPQAEDKFGIPTDVAAPAAAPAEPEQPAKPTRTKRAAAPEEPAAAVQQAAPAAAGDTIVDDIEAALAGLGM